MIWQFFNSNYRQNDDHQYGMEWQRKTYGTLQFDNTLQSIFGTMFIARLSAFVYGEIPDTRDFSFNPTRKLLLSCETEYKQLLLKSNQPRCSSHKGIILDGHDGVSYSYWQHVITLTQVLTPASGATACFYIHVQCTWYA